MTKRIIIAIDGPAGAGKSTTARRVAERLGYLYIDTGAMYRAVTLAALQQKVPLTEAGLRPVLDRIDVRLVHTAQGQRTYVDGHDVSDAIRQPDVTNAVSLVAALSVVRRALVEMQRSIASGGGVVMDGRDIGSVVFPGAEVKIYLVADADERVRRRLAEAQRQGIAVDEAEVRRQILERDRIDSQREDSPLVRPDGAVEVDTTSLTIDEQVDRITVIAEGYLRTYGLISAFGGL